MNLLYSSKAKDDLARIDWRIRQDIILKLDRLFPTNDASDFLNQLKEENLFKIDLDDYLLLGNINNIGDFLALSVIKKQQIKLPIE